MILYHILKKYARSYIEKIRKYYVSAPWRVFVLIQVGVASLHESPTEQKTPPRLVVKIINAFEFVIIKSESQNYPRENQPHLTRSPRETMRL